ncbi:MAG: hypothetical protein GXY83_13830 [Rhodopirellula sp.]|nr:hypothetical protein [Rhodopirellula sp.]
MDTIISNPLLGVAMHAVGATFAATCYTPERRVRGWSWQTYWIMAAITGLFWYGQFFFYNLGHVRMGHYKFTSWAIHMIMLVLISNVVGIVLREWRLCRRLTRVTLATALTVLIAAVLLLTYGNYTGDLATRDVQTEFSEVQ